MATGAALLSASKVYPFIDIRPDLKKMIEFCESKKFRTQVAVNNAELSSYANTTIYSTKEEYRQNFKDFLTKSSEDFLLYFYCGHGSHQWNWTAKNNSECLCILDDCKEWYADYELTEDIDEFLPVGKTLYVVVDACHSGGLLNVWRLDTRLEKSVIFFTGANSEIPAWDDKREGKTGGLFTNSFTKHASIGAPIWQIADSILQEMFKPNQKNARSPSVGYSRPALAISKFFQ